MGWKSRTLKALPPPLAQLAAQLRARLPNAYAVTSYSQEGEDLILRRIFSERSTGFYVDVGAHHPRRFSNTHTFYRAGWRGINIEPNPDAQRLFATQRPRDVNLQLGVADRPGSLTYYVFDEPALNTFDAELMRWRLANTPYKVIGNREVAVERLDAILERHLPAAQQIDFLSIDVEGLDFAVLASNDWQRYRPHCVLIEVLAVSIEDAMRGDAYSYLRERGYELFAKTYNTLVFRDGRAAGDGASR
jgi:FkbM family methyltransferase